MLLRSHPKDERGSVREIGFWNCWIQTLIPTVGVDPGAILPGSSRAPEMDPKWGRIWPRFGSDFGVQSSKIEFEIEFDLEGGFEFEFEIQLDTDLELRLDTEPVF